MKTLLDTGHTWFFDGLVQGLDETLVIKLCEGIKGPTALPFEALPGVTVGPYFPVEVTAESRLAAVTFHGTKGFLVFNESISVGDQFLEADPGKLRECIDGQFLRFMKSATGVSFLSQSETRYFLLWTEDRLIQVASDAPPSVEILDQVPDLSVQRTQTWSAT